jgi:hypothetical protein
MNCRSVLPLNQSSTLRSDIVVTLQLKHEQYELYRLSAMFGSIRNGRMPQLRL